MNRYIRLALIVIGVIGVYVAIAWLYTTGQLARARSEGVYPSAEAGMLAHLAQSYSPDHTVKIYYAGPNARYGNPHIWYVIAEVRASARAGGSEMGRNGCDYPGSFFLHPAFIGTWMKRFGWLARDSPPPQRTLFKDRGSSVNRSRPQAGWEGAGGKQAGSW